jgi:SAM-dependent methyltransferase
MSNRPPATQAEERRLSGVYGAYRADVRKRRAWSAENAGNAQIRLELLRRLLRWVPTEGAILDVGCGRGWWLAALLTHGVAAERLAAVDLLSDRVRAARRAAPGAEVAHADARDLPFPAGTFALVTLIATLSSASTQDDVLRMAAEAARVTAAGGTVVVWEPRWTNPLNQQTLFVSPRALETALGRPCERHTLTLVPAVARRLGPLAAMAYPRLAALPPLRSHQLQVYRPAPEIAP